MSNIQDKVVIITGASSGIGEATAKLLAKKGNKIVLGARREERLKEIMKDIDTEGELAAYQVTDVTKHDDVEDLAKLALDKFGRIDVWINNAGLMPHSTFDKLKVKEWERMVDVNIKGVLYGIAAALPSMRERKSGHFINLSSVAGHQTHPGGGVYSGTKYAVRAISEALRQEEAVAKSNVRVTIISPGAVATELPNTITDEDLKQGINQLYEAVAISPERIAETIAFAIDTPSDTTMNEILLRPTVQEV
ncbi:NADP-dependent 3-hydroxy acid dehydrogenase YdfG [Scopulibacillus darangshiensis]|uniref:NADP-dependent 3-hydroxy acid dehydrogenase YdfG n=1 Tax=Scopulibacillus darangshiensis TaxID=442528 RepID=A0A4R2NK26_9BACL|nr:SDR family oxidoreductase [Scopulibacillus darangshiensis]TCP21494.1 NADP-dependent 3-hydroxy acid dehydrogenase YdfG [Scopulibacillus darangshiensis]